MRIVLLACCLAVCALAQAKDEISLEQRKTCESFKTLFKKTYADEEEETSRCKNILANKELIDKHNAKNTDFKLDLNDFSDMSPREFAKTRLGAKLIKRRPTDEGAVEFSESKNLKASSLPTLVNLVNNGLIGPIKNQGSCGSCWAFAATGSLESAYALKYRTKISLSEQQLVDCDRNNYGCNGGNINLAYSYIYSYGQEATKDYTYANQQTSCKYVRSKVAAKLTGYYYIPDTNGQIDSIAMTALALNNSLAVYVCANNNEFKLYRTGVYTSTSSSSLRCPDARIDHAVLLVGYGTTGGVDYWLLRNSWDTTWGQAGYMQIRRNVGLVRYPSFPVVA